MCPWPSGCDAYTSSQFYKDLRQTRPSKKPAVNVVISRRYLSPVSAAVATASGSPAAGVSYGCSGATSGATSGSTFGATFGATFGFSAGSAGSGDVAGEGGAVSPVKPAKGLLGASRGDAGGFIGPLKPDGLAGAASPPTAGGEDDEGPEKPAKGLLLPLGGAAPGTGTAARPTRRPLSLVSPLPPAAAALCLPRFILTMRLLAMVSAEAFWKDPDSQLSASSSSST